MPITGKKVKVALSDFPEPMTWEDASNACKSLGKGWRLPTMAELGQIAKHLDEIGGFCSFENRDYSLSTIAYENYWSSDKRDWKYEGWFHCAKFTKYSDGRLMYPDGGDWSGKNEYSTRYKVRAVKTVR